MAFLHPGSGEKHHFLPKRSGISGNYCLRIAYEPCKTCKFISCSNISFTVVFTYSDVNIQECNS